jgi:DNA-binding NarL/FixJ family response regulator
MPDGGADLEARALAMYRAVDYSTALHLYEQAFAAYRQTGDALAAARVGRALCWLHSNVHGGWAVANGWTGRALAMLEGAGDDSAEHGWTLVMQAPSEVDPARQQEALREALALGRRHGDTDLECEAQGWLGLSLVADGRLDEGLALFDGAMAMVCAGEVVDVYVVEGTFCGMFLACELAHDVVRAEQWLRVAADVVNRPHMAGVSAFCRSHYGGILTAAGRWDEAEAALAGAAELFEGTYPGMRSAALVRLADLRVRQGRFEEAVELLEGLDHHPDAARPLAAVHLARGRTELARDLLERTLTQRGALAPPAGPILSLLVDVHLAEGAVDEAGRAAERLAALAAGQRSDYLRAAAALARGKVCVASGSADSVACLQQALSLFGQAQLPVELAQARLELARAAAIERPEVAVAQATAALHAFEQLEAARDADAAAALLRDLGGPPRTGPRRRMPLTKREAQVLELLGRGLSNPEIGDRLYISRKTVEHHVGHVLAKLGLRSRAEAAAYSARAGRVKPGVE